jgi:hypothetical protein
MSEFIAYPLEALNETYLNISHAHVKFYQIKSFENISFLFS